MFTEGQQQAWYLLHLVRESGFGCVSSYAECFSMETVVAAAQIVIIPRSITKNAKKFVFVVMKNLVSPSIFRTF
jgi:hypothetical protein